MRIAMVYDCIFPYVKGGGERTFAELAKRLGQRHKVHLFGMNFWKTPTVKQLAPNVWAHGVCRPMRLYTQGEKKCRSIKQALLFAAGVPAHLLSAGGFDIIDCMATPYFPLYGARIAASLSGVPLVSTWLEVWPKHQWQSYLGRPKGTLAKHVERGASRLPDHILAISRQTYMGLLGLGVPSGRMSLVAPGIDYTCIRAAPKALEESDIIYVGRFIREKRVDTIIRAVGLLSKRYPTLRCTIVGDGPERTCLEVLTEKLGITNNVRFAGFLAESTDVYSAMKASRLFVLASQREGFGIVAVEAAACGLPVLTVDCPNNAARHLVADGGFGAVCNPSADDIAFHMEAILRDGDRRRRYGENGTSWSESFDWGRVASRVEAVYEAVMARNRVLSGDYKERLA